MRDGVGNDTQASDGLERRAYRLRGVVQGVGFRPHVARVAGRYPLTGFVGNDDLQVFLEIQGDPAVLDACMEELLATLPALAHVIDTAVEPVPVVAGEEGFRIVASRRLEGQRSLIPPDTCLCPACRAELFDPDDRRYLHPFITCTECGPRLSIIRDLPYDRPLTTMVDFPMCEDCAREYGAPEDRRFHAQPVSCWVCGPALWLVDRADLPEQEGVSGGLSALVGFLDDEAEEGTKIPERLLAPVDRTRKAQLAALREARSRLAAGQILAVKGIGGFHLLCDARNEQAVARLRARKRGSAKPFAVMARDLDTARSLVHLTGSQEDILTSPARPILIAPGRAGAGLAASVAPGLGDIGVMLPYAPLHELLMAPAGAAPELGGPAPDVLVATSGNSAAEPLTHTNVDALARLAHLADAFLLHDRGIHVPVEDSVLLAAHPEPGSLPDPNPATAAGEVASEGARPASDISEASAGQSERGGVTSSAASGATQVSRDAGESAGGGEPAASGVTAGSTILVRRSRGYAPLPLLMPLSRADSPVVLGVGGEYKNTFTLAEGDLAFTSAHVGDMGSWASQQAFETSVAQLTGIHRREPDVLVHDLHPDYATTAWARRYADAHPSVQVLAVQHHWAHALALLAEHGIERGPVVVAAIDGTGYGLPEPEPAGLPSAAGLPTPQPGLAGVSRPGPGVRDPWAPELGRSGIWGGEILTLGPGGDLRTWERSWHVPWFPLAGGDRAVKRPWRTALGLARAWGIEAAGTPAWEADPAEREVLLAQLETGMGVVPTSSLGRVFDACAALLGVCEEASYEAQAAMELEYAARTAAPQNWNAQTLPDLVREVLGQVTGGLEVTVAARRIHDGIAWILATQMRQVAEGAGAHTVGISGGVAMNRLVSARLRSLLEAWGFTVLTHQHLPANDGGLSLGQAYAGRLLAERSGRC